MNLLEHSVCGSSFWRGLTQRYLLPWLLRDVTLGDHLLELGAGYGAATSNLRPRVLRLTSIDHDHRSVLTLKSRTNGLSETLCADVTRLPFASQTFSSALAILVAHHLKSTQVQDHMFCEAFRVLRPSGTFVMFEIHNDWIHRIGHIRSTFTPLDSQTVQSRLTTAGFTNIVVDARTGGFKVLARRPANECP